MIMSMYNHKNSYISKIITTKFFHDPTSHTQQKYFCSQNTISTKIFRTRKIFPYSYPQNFAINYTCQQIFHIHHDFVQPSLHNKFFTISMPPKFKPKFIQQTSQITNIAKILHNFNARKIQAKTHPTTSQITNIAKIP